MPAVPVRPATLEVLITAPPPPAAMTGMTCLSPRNTPMTLTSSTRRKSARGYSAIGRTGPSIPALLKKISIRPVASRARATKAATDPSSVTSPSTAIRPSPCPSPAASFCRATLSRSTATMRAPRAIISLTVAAPISPAAPVTSATLPSSRLLSSILAASASMLIRIWRVFGIERGPVVEAAVEIGDEGLGGYPRDGARPGNEIAFDVAGLSERDDRNVAQGIMHGGRQPQRARPLSAHRQRILEFRKGQKWII